MEEKWSGLEAPSQQKFRAWGITYIILSFVVFVGLAIYSGTKKW
jgi:hypothetical protein